MENSNTNPCAKCPYWQAAENHLPAPCQAVLAPKQQEAVCQALKEAIARERRIGRRDFATQCANALGLNYRLVFDFVGTLMTEQKVGSYQQPLGLTYPKMMLCALNDIPSQKERQAIKKQMRKAYATKRKSTLCALDTVPEEVKAKKTVKRAKKSRNAKWLLRSVSKTAVEGVLSHASAPREGKRYSL